MARFTRSNAQKNSKSVRKKRLSKNRFHRFFGQIDFFATLKAIFRGKVLLISVCTGMLLFILFAVFSSYFSLKEFLITTESATPTTIEIEKKLEDFLGKNLFLLNKTDIKNSLSQKFLEMRDVSVSTKWPNTLEIKFGITPAFYTVNNEETVNNVTLSEEGLVLFLNATEGLPILKLRQHEKKIQLREKILEKDDLQKIVMAEKLLQEKLEIILKERIYLYQAQEIHFVIKRDKATIWIDLTQDIEEQVQKLALAEKRIQFQSKNFKHIDLRIPKQIFWEWK